MANERKIDAIDEQILAILQSDGRATNVDIARKVGLAPSAALGRIRRLMRDGVVREFVARVAPEALGYAVTAFVLVRTDAPLKRTQAGGELARLANVLEVHDVAGEACYLLKVVARDISDLHHLLHVKIGNVAHVRSTTTSIVLETLKDTTHLPIASGSRAAARSPRRAKPRSSK